MISEEVLQKFIREELWELVDAVVDAQYYGGPGVDLSMIEEKQEKLRDLLGPDEVKESPSLNQIGFIINNALREYDREKRKGQDLDKK